MRYYLTFLILFTPIACSSTAPPAEIGSAASARASQEQRVTYRQELANTLSSRLAEKGLKVESEAGKMIEAIIRAGAEKLASDGPSEEELAKARKNIQTLADEIVAVAIKRGHSYVTEEDVTVAMKICPLYPFCD